MQIHTLQPSTGSTKKKKRVGRGNSSGKGTYSTRGLKGQRARSGGKKGLKLKGLRRTIKRIPKKRGFRSLYAGATTITLDTLNRFFKDGAIVGIPQLREARILGTIQKRVKIVSRGKLEKKFIIEGCAVSSGAKKLIESKGGTIR